MTTLPIRDLTTSFWLQYGSSGITPFSQRIGLIVEGTSDQGMSVLTPSGRAGLDLIGDDLNVTGSNIHFWDASSIVGGVPQRCQKLACNNSLHGSAPNAMYMRSTSDNGAHNHESFRWFFNGSTTDTNNGNCAALNNFGVGVLTDVWIATAATNVLTIANGTAPSSLPNNVHVYSSSGNLKAMVGNGGGVQLTDDPRWTKVTGPGAAGPQFDLFHNCSGPAANDYTSKFRFRGKNSSATEISYAEINQRSQNVTAGAENGRIEFWTVNAGTSAVRAYLQNGFSVGTATDPGAGGIMFMPGASVTPLNNGEATFQATSNTSFTIKYKGSDGTVRSGSITLS